MAPKGRPSRNGPAPTPVPGSDYCVACGRVMPSETSNSQTSTTPRKYCSTSCRTRSKDKSLAPYHLEVARTFHELLTTPGQGAGRVVLCSEVEGLVEERLGGKADGEHAIAGDGQVQDDVSRETLTPSSPKIPTSKSSAEPSPPTSPTPTSTPKVLTLPLDHRESTRRTARRLVVHGFPSQGIPSESRNVEAVQSEALGSKGAKSGGREGGGRWRVVEGSFAKGEWGIRWVG